MRSRAARLTSTALACIALGGAALFSWQVEQQRTTQRDAARRFEQRADEASTSVGAARAALQAYVAAGQSSSIWMPKAAAFSSQSAANIEALRNSAVSTDARQALLEATASIAEFGTIDKRARDYLAAGEPLMAGDVVFSEGAETAADIEHQLTLAQQAEAQELGARDRALGRLQAYAAGGGALVAVIVLLALGLGSRERASVAEAHTSKDALVQDTTAPPAPAVESPTLAAEHDAPLRESLALSAAADVCTAFGQVHDAGGLKRVLGQAAAALDASGIVVWLGSADGADLRPVVAHGYSDHVLGLMRPVARQADNAAAAAYRSSKLQIVAAKPGTSLGAVVAPILAPDGCIGALTAEIRDNSEVSDTVHAVAMIVASQLAGILSSPAQAATTSSHAASA